MDIKENLIELVDIETIETIEKRNMIDLSIDADESFILSNGFISHNSALGGVAQIRDVKHEGAFALKGKIKNVRSVSDLSDNQEIVQLMSVLDLDLDPSKRTMSFKRIIVASDADCLHEDTNVLTPNGFEQLKNLKIGDQIQYHDGVHNIIGITEQITTDFYCLLFPNKKETIYCTPGHKWPVLDKKTGKTIVLRTDEINDDHYFLISQSYGAGVDNHVQPKILKAIMDWAEPQRFIDITLDSEDHLFFICDGHSLISTHNCDGGHIATLLTNLFCRWFPYVVDEGRLYRLLVPLVSVGSGKSIEYFYDMEEFKQIKSPKNVRYLKGLGSLSPEDWDYVMKNKKLQQIKRSDDTMKYLAMAFDSDSGPRKNWLKGETF